MGVKTRSLLAGVVCFTAAVAAHADVTAEGFYLGGGYSEVSYEEDNLPEADLSALFVRGGYQLNQNLALEARLGTGVGDDSIGVYGVDVDVELDNFYGFYAKAGLPTQSGFYPYVLLGFTHAEVEASAGGYTVSDDGSDVSYGIGVDYWFNSTTSAGLEWARFYDKDDTQISGITLGINLKF